MNDKKSKYGYSKGEMTPRKLALVTTTLTSTSSAVQSPQAQSDIAHRNLPITQKNHLKSKRVLLEKKYPLPDRIISQNTPSILNQNPKRSPSENTNSYM